jgi:transcriptional regulator with XRE-family HTH domain
MPLLRADQVQKDVGRRVAELRRERGLTQAELADRASVSTNYVARVETGLQNLTLESLTKLANLFGLPIQEFFQEPADRRVRPGRPPGSRGKRSQLKKRR